MFFTWYTFKSQNFSEKDGKHPLKLKLSASENVTSETDKIISLVNCGMTPGWKTLSTFSKPPYFMLGLVILTSFCLAFLLGSFNLPLTLKCFSWDEFILVWILLAANLFIWFSNIKRPTVSIEPAGYRRCMTRICSQLKSQNCNTTR